MKAVLLCATVLSYLVAPAFAQAQTSDTSTPKPDIEADVNEIVVTANKRAQSINSVAMSITATSADTLLQKGVVNTADLVKAVPGFAFTQSPYSTPIYTLRGVGLYDYGLGSSPAVAVYVDEVPLTSTSMGAGSTLDLERVEVLKGPQGTLFGQSSTGGAINYIAAKPTDTLRAGGSITYERFGKIDATGYISGPVSDTLNARLSGRMVQGGDWQKSVTRPNDRAGAQRLFSGRLLLDWKPSDRLTLRFNANGNRDGGDTVLPQLQSVQVNTVAAPTAANPYGVVNPSLYATYTTPPTPLAPNPGYDGSFLGRQALVFDRLAAGDPGTLALLSAPLVNGNNARLAEWNSDIPHRRFDSFYQFALRGEYKLSDDVTFTSITAYARQKVDRFTEFDGTTATAPSVELFGSVKSFNQEIRLSGLTGPLTWIIGASYDSSVIDDNQLFNVYDNSISEAIPGLRFGAVNSNLALKKKAYSAFANAEYEITDQLTFQAGIRYNENKQTGFNCSSDASVEQNFSKTFTLLTGATTPILAGQCYPFNDVVAPTDPAYFKSLRTPFKVVLNEENVPWRVGLSYKFSQGALLYANMSTGYKAGIVTGFAASAASQYAPAKQEKLVAYEVGFKVPLAARRVQLNGAAFYYDYSDKQVRARVLDFAFGLLEKSVNVPKSRIWGLEGEVVVNPVEGLNFSLAGTYLNTKVTKSFNGTVFNQQGYRGDFVGSDLPFSPEFSGVMDAEYTTPVGDNLKAAFGTTLTYHSPTNATFRTATLRADEYAIKAYALLDLRANIGAADDAWRLSIYGRNVTNTLVVNTIFAGSDARWRQVGMPTTYGATVSFQLR
ncbi:hypothetical protein BH11PSE5_BH11PSE5_17060 [soil metagenome]